MKVKGILIGFYVFMIFCVAIYGTFWGDFSYKGFFYNLGRGIVWPLVIFPGLGKLVGGALLLLIVSAIMMS